MFQQQIISDLVYRHSENIGRRMTNRLRSITDFDKTRTESGNFGPAHSFNESRNNKRQKRDYESLSSSNSTI